MLLLAWQLKAGLLYNAVQGLDGEVLRQFQHRVGVKETGKVDDDTTQAVAQYQSDKGLKVDGSLGPITRATMPDVFAGEIADRRTQEAAAYNVRRAPALFMDQSTRELVYPGTKGGVEWVRRLQSSLNLTVDGKLGPNSQEAYIVRAGPFGSDFVTRHPLPWWVSRWGYDHAHAPGAPQWPVRDVQWAEMLQLHTWVGGMLGLVSGYKAQRGTTNRGPDSVISLDFSLGPWHVWSKRVPGFMSKIIGSVPEGVQPWDEREMEGMRSRRWISEHLPMYLGKRPYSADYNWFVSGWWHIARHPQWIEAMCDWWLDQYVASGLRLVHEQGWTRDLKGEDGGRILAASVRLCNSGSGNARRRIRAARKDSGHTKPMPVLEATYLLPRAEGGYGKRSRWERIISTPGFRGSAPEAFRAIHGLDLRVTPTRPNGEVIDYDA